LGAVLAVEDFAHYPAIIPAGRAEL
jgi:hypothetical protein